MKIHSLLNPCGKNEQGGSRGSESPIPAPKPHSVLPHMSMVKRPKAAKAAKDAPIFAEGVKIVGHINYPPHETGIGEELAYQHARYRVYPIGQIRKIGARHIPYNSDKKDFLGKTGRESFEVFQYVYQVPGDKEMKEWVVLWDYNVGLVRMTPFFKSLQHSKTIPAKAIRENPGLKDVTYSITGGALICQGYWVPYQAARAIAATFCWHIRWALTPVFGDDFPAICLPPNDPKYCKFRIAPKIVQECIDETNRFRQEGLEYKIAGQAERTMTDTPQLPCLTQPWEPNNHDSRMSEESGYYTGGDQNERLTVSPQVSPRGSTWISTVWTPVNGSPSASSQIIHSPTFDRMANELPPIRRQLREHFSASPTSVPLGYYEEPYHNKRPHSDVVRTDGLIREVNAPFSTVASHEPIIDPVASNLEQRIRTRSELEAAEIILQLNAADRALPAPKRTRRGSQY